MAIIISELIKDVKTVLNSSHVVFSENIDSISFANKKDKVRILTYQNWITIEKNELQYTFCGKTYLANKNTFDKLLSDIQKRRVKIAQEKNSRILTILRKFYNCRH